jgi:hypothetical protein
MRDNYTQLKLIKESSFELGSNPDATTRATDMGTSKA